MERGTCIKGLFWPPLELKTENYFSQSVKFRHLFKFYRCYGDKNGRQNRHKIAKLPFLTIFKAFRDRIVKN